MKNKLFKQATLTAVMLASVVAASATPLPVNITVQQNTLVAYSTELGNYGDGTVFAWLTTDVANYNSLTSASLPAPVAGLGGTPMFKANISNGGPTLSLNLDGSHDYIFLHWGGQASPAQAFYIGGYTGSYDFNAPGEQPTVGGISFFSFYGQHRDVPDGGSTLAMLGGLLSVLGAGCRRLKK
jgi:hypothetical protein